MPDRWLTYSELAAVLGCSPAAARAKAMRKRWRRQVGNDRQARVLLPEDAELRGARDPTAQVHVPRLHTRAAVRTPEQEAELLERLERLQSAMAALAQKFAAAEALTERLGAAEGELKAVKEDRDHWRALAERLTERLAERRPGLIERLAAVLRRAG